jgi:hypothetical protein
VGGFRLHACLVSASASFTRTTRHILEVPTYLQTVKDVALGTDLQDAASDNLSHISSHAVLSRPYVFACPSLSSSHDTAS